MIEWPEKQELYIGYSMMCLGLGLSLGPVIGSFVYSAIGYVNTFYFFTGFIFGFGAFCILLIPSRINQIVTENNE